MKRMAGTIMLVVVLGAWGPCSEPDVGCLRYSGTTCIIGGHSASEHHAATCLERHAGMSRAKLMERVLSAPTERESLISACECIRWFPADGKERPEATEFRASIERQCGGLPAGILRTAADSDYWF